MTPAEGGAVALPEADPRDREVQAVALALVEAYAFAEAVAVLQLRLCEIRCGQITRNQRLFLEWSALDPETRPDFLTFSHRRRRPEIAAEPKGTRT